MINNEIIKLKFDNSFNGQLFAVQGDTGRVFNLQVFDDFSKPVDVTGMKLRMYVANSKEVSYSEGEIVEASEGKIKVQVYNSQLKYPGKQKAQFIITDKDGQKIGSKIFDLWIEEGLEAGPTVGRNIYVDFENISEILDLIKNYDKELEKGREVDTSLKVEIKEGVETKNSLVECKDKALEIGGQLDNSKIEANKILESLKNKGDTLFQNLSSKVTEGENLKSNLDRSVSSALNAKINLDRSIASAVNENNSLIKAEAAAKNTETFIRDLMNKLNLTKDEVSKIVAAGDLSKYITEPKLQEALKNYVTKSDLADTDIIEQLKNYAKKEDMPTKLSDLQDDSTHRTLTDIEKTKLESIEDGANKVTKISQLENDKNFKTEEEVKSIVASDRDSYFGKIPKIVLLTNDEYNNLSNKEENTLYALK